MQEASTLPAAPHLDSLGLPPELLRWLQQYVANEAQSWHGVGVVLGKEDVARDVLYALLAEHAKVPVHIHIIDHEEGYEVPEPPRRYQPLPADAEVSLDDLIDRQDESAIVHMPFADVAEYVSRIRAATRWDPDIIALGAMPNAEVARMALMAALTGHRVLAKAPYASIAETIEKLRAADGKLFVEALAWVLCVQEKGSELLLVTPKVKERLQKNEPLTMPDVQTFS